MPIIPDETRRVFTATASLGADVTIPVLGMVGESNETFDSALNENEERHARRAMIHRNRPNKG